MTRLVREFHEAFDQPRPDAPGVPTQETVALRLDLLREEMREVEQELVEIDALLQRAKVAGTPPNDAALRERLALLTKELADLRYVTDGAAVALGLPLDEAFEIVHRSNMS